MNYEHKRASGPFRPAGASGGPGLYSPENMPAAQLPCRFGADVKTRSLVLNVPISHRAMD